MNMRPVYDATWHDDYGAQTLYSAEKILPYIFQLRPVNSILEIGCGHGHWLRAALDLGVHDVIGIDGDWTDRSKLLFPTERFHAFDLSEKVNLNRKFDLVTCLEVGEHLSDHSSGQLVDNIVRHSDLVLFGAAIPYQGGYKHINERWPSYWFEKFHSRGYVGFDIVRPEFWTDRSIHYYYRQNTLVYVNVSAKRIVDASEQLRDRMARQRMPLDLVHPEKYELIASYKAVVLKRIIPRLPAAILSTLRRKLKL
jgi:SAM-dependent methyltransferase